MKRFIAGTVLFVLFSAFTARTIQQSNSSAVYPQRTNSAFQVGEELTYRLHYGFVDAGEAKLKVLPSFKRFDGRQALHVVGEGRSVGAFNLFFKVRDTYESYIDAQSLVPHKFIRDVNEGGYKLQQEYDFKHSEGEVITQDEKSFDIPMDVQDMISSFYYARNLDFSNAQPGDLFTINTFLDNELYPFQIKYVGKENVKVREGEFKCLKFVPVVQEGRIFEDEDALNVWVTDDANHIPVLAKAKVLVGSIKMELTDYKGLKSTIARID